MKAKKHLGQHFLTSKKVLSDIIKAASVVKGDAVLEIGPGKGVLTNVLLETGAKVVAIETDPDMIEVLNEKFVKEILSKQLTLIEGDVLDLNIKNYLKGEYKLVANIPYYITGEILRRFLSSDYQPSSVTVLVQKEVAERIAKSKKETILSLSIKAYGKPFYITSVPARYFTPKPKVDSAVLHISNISKNFFDEMSEERFFKLIKAGFSSKRKKLINNLSVFGSKTSLEKSLVGFINLRAEDISLEEWKTIYSSLA